MTVVAKVCRRMTPKTFAISAIGLTILLCIYYANYTTTNDRNNQLNGNNDLLRPRLIQIIQSNKNEHFQKFNEKCPKLFAAETDINTVDIFKDFEFQPSWMKSKEYWDKSFEDRYERQKMDPERPPLKVIIVPHSHNDPGWLKTFEHYFHYASRQIINHMVTKLQQYKNLTFIWSEVAFLNEWWDEAHPSKQRALRHLVESGRLEITTGGWVMTDEANAHLFAMVDQLIEGHQWLWTNLGVKPKSGWSVDPFGHGSTQPYLLSQCDFKGTVIQRIHYAWKQWLALKQYGDFKWMPNFQSKSSILTHNQPFDIYSIKHSCGPHPYICLNFDFRKVPGEYTEYSIKAQTINEKNIKEKSELLLEQYARTGSLLPHNVVLMPLGDDFRYNVLEEWDQQYLNYIKLINYINSHKDVYKTEITFGTPLDYFNEITKRYTQYPLLKGDFFVYSDIFSEGRPAYWSGYFTTRPFMKILDRDLEANLRAAEILYTQSLNYARQYKLASYLKILERDYEKLVNSRRNLALFQHHDAITGTSKSFVMRDYGLKLFEGIRYTISIQENSLKTLLFSNKQLKPDDNVLLSDLERDSYEKLVRKTVISIGNKQTRKIFLYNSLGQNQDFLIQLRTNTSDIKITDGNGLDVLYQINPVWDSNLKIVTDEFEVMFIMNLKGLSVSLVQIVHDNSNGNLATIYCNKCQRTENNGKLFQMKNIPLGDIQLENHKMKLLFNGNNGFLKTLTRKLKPKIMQLNMQFAAYKSAQFHSGAYLFMPDPNERDIEKDVLQQYKEQMSIIITSGQISSELTVIYGQFLIHNLQIFHTNTTLADALYVETTVDFESPPKNRETELFMRLISDVQNGEPPEFYTDLNGFQMQKRVKIDRIGIEGNYYPITQMAFIQDDNVRLSLLTNHAQGAASWQPGYLEVMLDRRTLYDDARGMGEGLVDNKKTVNKFWILIEDISPNMKGNEQKQRFDFDKDDILRNFNQPTIDYQIDRLAAPSLFANQMSNMLNYPVGVFIVDASRNDDIQNKTIDLFDEFGCDLHLLTLRTQPDSIYSQFPSNNALMVVHRQGYDCAVNSNFTCNQTMLLNNTFNLIKVKKIQVKSLTGLDLNNERDLRDFSDIYLDSMTLKTFNVSFI